MSKESSILGDKIVCRLYSSFDLFKGVQFSQPPGQLESWFKKIWDRLSCVKYHSFAAKSYCHIWQDIWQLVSSNHRQLRGMSTNEDEARRSFYQSEATIGDCRPIRRGQPRYDIGLSLSIGHFLHMKISPPTAISYTLLLSSLTPKQFEYAW